MTSIHGCPACTQHDVFFISLMFIHTCACKIDDIKALVQSTRVCTRRVHYTLHEHTCMSVTYTPYLVCMHVDKYMNCNPYTKIKLLQAHHKQICCKIIKSLYFKLLHVCYLYVAWQLQSYHKFVTYLSSTCFDNCYT